MKYLAGLFFSILLVYNAQATTLCDASCELIITFPDDGAIVANEAVLFTFGSDGELNLAATGTVNINPQPASLNYTSGGTLALAKGESITFGSNASVLLGVGGNVDYTDMTISSTGGANLKAIGNTETITIDNLTIAGGLDITFDGKNILILGNVATAPDSVITVTAGTGGLAPSVCNIQDVGSGVTLTAGTIDTSRSCNTIFASLSLPAGSVTTGTLDPNASLISSGSIILTPAPTTIAGAGGITLQVQSFTQEQLLALADGTELSTDDGNTCAVTAGECVAASGDKYTVVDGKLVLVSNKESQAIAANESAAGASGLLSSFILFALLGAIRLANMVFRKTA